MPELPDITLYMEALKPRVVGRRLSRLRVRSIFLVRSFDPPIEAAENRSVLGSNASANAFVFALEGDLFLVLHLMIAGRLLWKKLGAAPRGKVDLAAFDFENDPQRPSPGGTLLLYEAGTQNGPPSTSSRVAPASPSTPAAGSTSWPAPSRRSPTPAPREPHHQALPHRPAPHRRDRNAYSDEILHAAKLSPLRLTSALTDSEITRLHTAARDTISHWTATLLRQFGIDPARGKIGTFPGVGDITAFRPDSPSTAGSANPAPSAAHPSSASSTPVTKQTTAPRVRPGERCWPTAPCRAC